MTLGMTLIAYPKTMWKTR